MSWLERVPKYIRRNKTEMVLSAVCATGLFALVANSNVTHPSALSPYVLPSLLCEGTVDGFPRASLTRTSKEEPDEGISYQNPYGQNYFPKGSVPNVFEDTITPDYSGKYGTNKYWMALYIGDIKGLNRDEIEKRQIILTVFEPCP